MRKFCSGFNEDSWKTEKYIYGILSVYINRGEIHNPLRNSRMLPVLTSEALMVQSTMQEVRYAIKKLKNNKAPRLDAIFSELMK